MANQAQIEEAVRRVRQALAGYTPFRHASEGVTVDAGGTGVEISGAVRTQTVANSALATARSAAAGVPLSSHLVADNVLEADIARTLARDERTAGYNVRVGAYFGRVTLVADLPDTVRQTAVEIVRGIAGVRRVDEADVRFAPAAEPAATMAGVVAG